MKAPVHEIVREGYARIAQRAGDACCPGNEKARELAEKLGYSAEDVSGPAATGNLGLGCGNPTALASLRPGEVVVDLGSGAGFDALLAAERIGEEGRFIGVDMTPEMLAKARANAVNAGYSKSVEFREGLIESLPVVSESADVVISNCVINLSPDKAAVFREAFRVLKPGGRLAVSDILLTESLPVEIAQSVGALVACVAGAETEEAYLGHIRDAGFCDIECERRPASGLLEGALEDPMIRSAVEAIGIEQARRVAETVFSYSIHARKP